MIQNEPISKTNRLTDWRTSLCLPGQEGWGNRIVREFGIDMSTLLYLKWITRSRCIAQGSLLNVMWQPEREGSLGKKTDTRIRVTESLCCLPETHNIVNWLKLSQHC